MSSDNSEHTDRNRAGVMTSPTYGSDHTITFCTTRSIFLRSHHAASNWNLRIITSPPMRYQMDQYQRIVVLLPIDTISSTLDQLKILETHHE
jgi:hypothetical protein